MMQNNYLKNITINNVDLLVRISSHISLINKFSLTNNRTFNNTFIFN